MENPKRIERMSISKINQLPEEINQEILINLPAKSVVRFKCVSKRWRSLISTKRFTKEHLKKSNDSTLIYSFYDRIHRSFSFRSCSLKHIIDEPKYEDYSVVATSDHAQFRKSSSSVLGIVGSCNGLLLIAVDKRDLLLWNPSTRQVKNISPPSYSEKEREGGGFRSYTEYFGVGYDKSADDYKVVYMFISRAANRTEMYSLSTDSWKKIENFDAGYLLCGSGKFVNGKLHWLVFEKSLDRHRGYVLENPLDEWGGNSCGSIIVSLDLVKEKYGIVALPQHFSSYSYFDLKMEILGGYLSMIYTDRFAGDTNVWVMMKYGEPDSWTKIWTQSEYVNPNPGRDLSLARPILFREDGDIAVLFGTLLVVYNVKDKSLKSRVYVPDDAQMLPYVCVESLVSPFGNEEPCRL